ncbi:hypothetical protein B0H16DRAFT_1396474 [Mycena metata]|uniref:BTB domain-containing protein n=1 Tax=Mycena metata TaxID=1033252 RepID=A0AAD7DS50_9AGAR|nr:hypothetical protein B0H16DRAFT_1396474 [Mycena metata]
METAPPPKRRRTETDAGSEPDPPAPPLTRSTEYWFDGGDIVLQVESTQFRLLKSILSMHSSVFRDMFTIPLPKDEPTPPVVVLPGDTAQDWTLLLGVIFPKSFSTELPPFRLVAAMLRLSKKYDFPLFRKECVRRLKEEFPTSLAEYNKVSAGWTFLTLGNEEILLSVVSLAREIGLPSILPLTYCLVVGGDENLSMTKILDPDDRSVNATDRLACLIGHARLLKLESTTMFAWLNCEVEPREIPSETCNDRVACNAAVVKVFFRLFNPHPQFWILHEWRKNWEDGICRPCRKKAKDIYDAGRETCWQQLPAVFGLPDWEELDTLDFE